jgi:hypothetical protein
MKKSDMHLKEYCQRLSDENLKFLVGRLGQRLSGDLAEVLDFMTNVREVDRWLAMAETSIELYDMIDALHASVIKEVEKRSTANAF